PGQIAPVRAVPGEQTPLEAPDDVRVGGTHATVWYWQTARLGRRGPPPRSVLRLGPSNCSPRTPGPPPRSVLRLGPSNCSPRTPGPPPRSVLRLAKRAGTMGP